MSPESPVSPVSRLSAPARIVSLVPSWTETLFALELGDRLVGATEYCVHPAERLADVPRIGGTKNPEIESIVRLAPDLVIANKEENTERTVRQLRAAGLQVWVTEPRTVAQAVDTIAEIAALHGPETPAARRAVAEREVERLRRALAGAESAARPAAVRCLCPIWRDPWMVVGPDTYAHDLLRWCGAANPFADREDRRYPRVSLDEIVAAQPEVVLLPDEPYAFGEVDAAELAALPIPAARDGRIHLIDGTWVTWYGPRIERALERISDLLSPEPRAGSGRSGGSGGSGAGTPRTS